MLVVLTGAGAAAAPVQAELESAGVRVITVPDEAGDAASVVSSAIAARTAGQHVDAYVQLPKLLAVEQTPSGGSLVARMGQFLADGLLARFQMAAAVLPHLAEDASVVLVGGNTPVPGTAVDDQEARLALLRVLAHALRAEEAPRHLRVRVLPHGTATQTVAATALGREDAAQKPASAAPPGNSDVDMSYEDWRTQVLGLATVEF